MGSAGKQQRKILIIIENLPAPFDRRVWQEAKTLRDAGFLVSIACPTARGYEKRYEVVEGIPIYRYKLPTEGSGPLGYLIEYSAALFWQFLISWKVLLGPGFDAIHGCNPPDNIFLIAGFFKVLLRKKYLFDHHDINPELYEAKFGHRGFFYKVMLLWERWTFMVADISIATNESYKEIAITRGRMDPEKVYVVRSGPDLSRTKVVPQNAKWRNGRKFMVGYVGVMGAQEGLDHLLTGIRYLLDYYQRKDIQFVLVGGGTELEQLKGIADQLEITDYVTFTGRLPDELLMEVLSTADVCVNPDIVNEMNDKSTMNKIMEYMALGKPIVQYEMTEGRFSAQEASFYAEPNNPKSLIDNIVALIDDPEKRKEMGEFGRNRVLRTLEWKYEAPKLLAAYDALFDGSNS